MFEELLRFDKKKTYCFFDAETFNLCLNFRQNRAWQLGIVKVQGDNIIGSEDMLVNWTKQTDLRVGAEAARITRYDHSKLLALGKDPKEVWMTAEKYFEECDFIAGHNILNFDAYILKGWAEYLNRPWKHFTPKMIDTRCLALGMKLSIPYDRNMGSLIEYQYRMLNRSVRGTKTSLTALGKEYNIDHDYANLHNAIVDLQLNVKVWNKQKFQIEI
jgi:DNA polymerase III epsilon subunit-like protein